MKFFRSTKQLWQKVYDLWSEVGVKEEEWLQWGCGTFLVDGNVQYHNYHENYMTV